MSAQYSTAEQIGFDRGYEEGYDQGHDDGFHEALERYKLVLKQLLEDMNFE